MHNSKIRPVLGAVLAGGRGTRVGGDKPALELRGRPLIAHPLAALRAAAIEAVVVAKPETALPALDVPVVFDGSPVQHPLAGVVAALDHAAGRPVLVLAADMPNVTATLVLALARVLPEKAAVVVESGGALQPLCARYGPQTRAHFAAALAAEAPLRATVAALEPSLVLAEPSVVFNVNTPADLEAARGPTPPPPA